MQTTISRLALYVRDIPAVTAFYEKHFGFIVNEAVTDFMLLQSPSGGCALVLLQAGKGQKIGQSCVKIVFDVPDVVAFKEHAATEGLLFGPVHKADGYEYANAHDPVKNLIQISNRSHRK